NIVAPLTASLLAAARQVPPPSRNSRAPSSGLIFAGGNLLWALKFMPTTYNGVGTHYYGKSNVETRKGACPFCGSETTLTSYNTRLWFVVVFIPIIPLGKKRIIDYCPACTRHYAVDLKKWEAAKQLEISAALDKYRTTATHENAIAVHQTLQKFHQT